MGGNLRVGFVFALGCVLLLGGLALCALAPAAAVAATLSAAEFRICAADGDQDSPAVSGNTVVWTDYRHGEDNPDIYGYDMVGKTVFPICTADYRQLNPAISNNIVVWQDRRSISYADIYGYDLTSRTEFPICTAWGEQRNPAIAGNLVVWEDLRSGSGMIYAYDLATKTEFPVTAIGLGQGSPALSGNTVVWGGDDVFGCDLVTKSAFPICTANRGQYDPAISGNVVVWEDFRNNSGTGELSDLYARDLTGGTEFLVCPSGAAVKQPAISGARIVWSSRRSGSSANIYGYDLVSKTVFPICTQGSEQWSPAISGDIVVWCDARGSGSTYNDIYGARLFVDKVPPTTRAAAASVRARGTVTLKFRVNDAMPSCGKALVKIQIRKRTTVVRTITVGTRATNVALTYRYTAKLRRGLYNWRVLATDVAGNKAVKRIAAPLTVR